MEKITKYLDKFKYPLLILVIGIALMLIPSGSPARTEDNELQAVLCHAQGVGEAYVIVSENGVVVVCTGADSPKVKLDVIKAVSSYTGFSSDRITVLKNID